VRVVPAKGWGVSDPYGCASGRYGSGEYHHYVSCQVDADGNPSSSDLIATLASDVRVTGAPSEVPGRDCGHAAGDPQTRAGFRVVASIVSPLLRVFVASVPCGVGWSDRRSRMRPLKGIHRVQNGLHYGFVAYGRVDHQVKELARRPFHSEVLLDKGGAFTVNRPGKFNRLLLGLSPLLEATDLPFKGRIKENVKHAG